MRILVTGVTGVLGRMTARQLTAAGHAVSGIARYPHDQLDPEVDFVQAPLGGAILQRLADESDVVAHLAPIDPGVPGSAGINGVVRVTDAAARAGARLIFVSQAAGEPALHSHAETLVSSGWAPSLIIRIALPVGRQLDWMVCRTVATLLGGRSHGDNAVQPLQLLHLEDLVRFLALAVTANTTGVVDLAAPGTTNRTQARQLLRSVDQPSRRTRTWAQLPSDMNSASLQENWKFEFAWSACDALTDTARGLTGRKLDLGGVVDLPGHLPLSWEPPPRSGSSDGTPLHCAAPDGLEGEFDDRIDPRFPVFSAAPFAETLPGPLTPMTLDVQLGGLRAATRLLGRVMALGEVAAAEWGNRAIAVLGHRPYVGVSAGVLAASQLPGWDEQAVIEHALGGTQVGELLPQGRPPLADGLLKSAAKAVVTTRALAMLRRLKADTQTYRDAAADEHLDAAQLCSLPEARLQARIRLLRDRIQQGWGLTALWLIDTGITTAALERTAAGSPVPGVQALLESHHVAALTTELAALLRRDPRVLAVAERGDLAGIRVIAPTVAADVDAAISRVAHRGPGEVELANPVFGDDPAMVLVGAAASPAGPRPALEEPTTNLTARLAANAQLSRETAYDCTMRFTHDLRMTLREFGSRLIAADLLDAVDDVYYLTCDELLTLPGDARLRVKRRRAERDRLQSLRLPTVVEHTWRPLDTL
ncbi:NAD-dependent epimerase/dehydratase family protein [Mycobacterium sp.]|uniref:NAD-dependent epimerase/dehydratase family protein n=1 Tax=Mycobacterium sp. TaxID=1785 RepID=UPI001286FDD8|nr:NAD-dependent epimerase/dehydratase family protein [Mycobacterium sp.]KAA8958767.1 MAG: NAD-dependent epimerase/dehydratase family protein [Mycobacterium sp.]